MLSGKTAVITGGTSGLGKSAVSIFAAEGAQVIFVGRNQSAGAQIERDLRGRGLDVRFVAADVTLERDVARLAEEAAKLYGSIDVAFFNAGAAGTGKLITELSLEEFTDSISVNLTSAFLCLRSFTPILASPGGSVIFTSSIVSLTGYPRKAAYTAAKGGLNAFARAAAIELAPSRIRVNTIVPAGIMTAMSSEYIQSVAHIYGSKEAALAHYNGLYPLGRLADPEDVARTALFLASDQALMITGQAISVDGGMTAGAAPIT